MALCVVGRGGVDIRISETLRGLTSPADSKRISSVYEKQGGSAGSERFKETRQAYSVCKALTSEVVVCSTI